MRTLIFAGFLFTILFSCKKEPTENNIVNSIPTITTTSASSINSSSALSGGNISSDGGASVTARGVCWSTTANPVFTGNHTSDGTGAGAFSSTITGLNTAVTYYIRAYAVNSEGVAYGNEVTINIPAVPVIPVLTTSAVSSITNSSAISGGNISSDGGAPVTERGVCWSTAINPIVTVNHTIDGTGAGTFTSNITGLSPSTTYYARAYATNSVGTAYGNEISFSTSPPDPDVHVVVDELNSAQTISTIKYWKNGILTNISDGVTHAISSSLFVSGTDVYIAGAMQNGSVRVATIWKNGIPSPVSNITNVHSLASSVFVVGTDVYVAGTQYNGTKDVATIWKNGVPTTLTNGSNNSSGLSVYVAGGDVYVAGYEVIPPTSSAGKCWKNGTLTSLTNGTSARSVFVSGSDVYVVGDVINGTTNVATIWKNGIATSLTNGSHKSSAGRLFVQGTDIYVTGFENNGSVDVAKLWKNGVVTNLSDGIRDCYAGNISVSGTDVYVALADYVGPGTMNVAAKIWKNGVVTSLTNGSTFAAPTGLVVK